MLKIIISLLLFIVSPTKADEQPEVIAIVNGNTLTQEDYETYLQARTEQLGTEGQVPTKVIIQELIHRELIRQDALHKGFDTHPQLVKQLELIRNNLLTTLAIREYLKKHPLSEAQLKQAYQSYFVQNAPTEYRLQQIVVETETEAKHIIDALNQGQEFAELAQKHSIATKQSDLGWITAEQVEPSIAKALKELKKVSYTSAAVKSSMGWHILLLKDKRQSELPPFAAVKDQLITLLQPQILETYINTLKEQAEIKVIKQVEWAKAQHSTQPSPTTKHNTASTREQTE